MSQDHCLFCKLVRGEIPSARVLENDRVIAFLDIGPLNPGHVLVIPREHHAALPDLPDDLAAATAAVLPRLCRAVRQATGADGLNVLSNTGRVAGQSIEHVHWHIIPRHASDAIRWPWPARQYPPGQIDEMRQRIVEALEAAS
jgi:histidine triad (HIT) family protein